MFERRFWVAPLIIISVIIGGFALSVPRASEVSESIDRSLITLTVPVVTVHDSSKGGVHTISGVVVAPDVCATLTAEASVEAERIVVALSIPEDPEVCLHIPTRIPFSVSVEAPADMPISATVNGVTATTSSS